jgi:hypothetical protein
MGHKTTEIATAYRLEQYFDGLGVHLKDRRKKESLRCMRWEFSETASERAPSRSRRGRAEMQVGLNRCIRSSCTFWRTAAGTTEP